MTGGVASPGVGDRAPDLALPDQHGRRTAIADMVADRHALLVFFPFAYSPICAGELLEIQLNIDEFSNERVQVYGISCDPTHALRGWAAHEGYRFPLLSDFWPHGVASSAYGVFDEDSGMPRRGTFLISPEQRVEWALVHGPGEERPIGLLHAAVRGL